MEKFNFVRDGVIVLPPGFRFQPTDEELVFQYLKRKIYACPLPASIIPEIDVCKYDPWDLPGQLEQDKYFFCNKEAKYQSGKTRTKRATRSGYWKATGIDKRILSSRSNQTMGMKKTLVFYRGKPRHGSTTQWVMHEYRLVSAETAASIFPLKINSTKQSSLIQKEENWVICHIFQRKRSTRNNYRFAQISNDKRVFNIEVSSTPSSVSSSGSSGITEVSSTKPDREESSDENSVSSCCFAREQ